MRGKSQSAILHLMNKTKHISSYAGTEMPLGQEPPPAPWTRLPEECSLPPETSGRGIPWIDADSGETEELEHFLEMLYQPCFVIWRETPSDKRDAQAPLNFINGWNIGTPDKALEMPNAFQIPAQGTLLISNM